ncbi:unnamed protein product [Closterium sp. NIES-65]|nr:unnamed protein product [Closterium sp. NIES-65]
MMDEDGNQPGGDETQSRLGVTLLSVLGYLSQALDVLKLANQSETRKSLLGMLVEATRFSLDDQQRVEGGRKGYAGADRTRVSVGGGRTVEAWRLPYRMLLKLTDPQHGKPLDTAACILLAIGPHILMTHADVTATSSNSSKAPSLVSPSLLRSRALDFVTSDILTKAPKESVPAVESLMRYLCLHAPERAEGRAAAVEAVMKVYETVGRKEREGFFLFVGKLARVDRAAARVVALDLSAALVERMAMTWGRGVRGQGSMGSGAMEEGGGGGSRDGEGGDPGIEKGSGEAASGERGTESGREGGDGEGDKGDEVSLSQGSASEGDAHSGRESGNGTGVGNDSRESGDSSGNGSVRDVLISRVGGCLELMFPEPDASIGRGSGLSGESEPGEALGAGTGGSVLSVEEVLGMVRRRLEDEKGLVRKAAVGALEEIVGLSRLPLREELVDAIGELCSDSLLSVRRVALNALSKLTMSNPGHVWLRAKWLQSALVLILDNEATVQDQALDLLSSLLLQPLGLISASPRPSAASRMSLCKDRPLHVCVGRRGVPPAPVLCEGEGVCEVCGRAAGGEGAGAAGGGNAAAGEAGAPVVAEGSVRSVVAWLMAVGQGSSSVVPLLHRACAVLARRNALHARLVEGLQAVIEAAEGWQNAQQQPQQQQQQQPNGKGSSVGKAAGVKGGSPSRVWRWVVRGAWLLLLEVTSFSPQGVRWEFLISRWRDGRKQQEARAARPESVSATPALDHDAAESATPGFGSRDLGGQERRAGVLHGQVKEAEVLDGQEREAQVHVLKALCNVAARIPGEKAADVAAGLLHNLRSFQLSPEEELQCSPLPSVRNNLVIILTDLCVRHTAFVDPHELQRSPLPSVRNNLVIILTDLCVRYTALVDPHVPCISACLRDPCELVRRQTLVLLAGLLQRDYVKWRGALVLRVLLCIVDESQAIREVALYLFTHVVPRLLQKDYVKRRGALVLRVLLCIVDESSAIRDVALHIFTHVVPRRVPLVPYNTFIEALFALNACPLAPSSTTTALLLPYSPLSTPFHPSPSLPTHPQAVCPSCPTTYSSKPLLHSMHAPSPPLQPPIFGHIPIHPSPPFSIPFPPLPPLSTSVHPSTGRVPLVPYNIFIEALFALNACPFAPSSTTTAPPLPSSGPRPSSSSPPNPASANPSSSNPGSSKAAPCDPSQPNCPNSSSPVEGIHEGDGWPGKRGARSGRGAGAEREGLDEDLERFSLSGPSRHVARTTVYRTLLRLMAREHHLALSAKLCLQSLQEPLASLSLLLVPLPAAAAIHHTNLYLSPLPVDTLVLAPLLDGALPLSCPSVQAVVGDALDVLSCKEMRPGSFKAAGADKDDGALPLSCPSVQAVVGDALFESGCSIPILTPPYPACKPFPYQQVLAPLLDGALPLSCPSVQTVVGDALDVLSCKEMRPGSGKAAGAEEDGEEEAGGSAGGVTGGGGSSGGGRAGGGAAGGGAGALANALKGRVVTQLMKKNLVENTIPVLIELKRLLEARNSPLQGALMACLRCLFKEYKEEIEDLLAADPQLGKELVYDIQKHEAARARAAAAARAAGSDSAGGVGGGVAAGGVGGGGGSSGVRERRGVGRGRGAQEEDGDGVGKGRVGGGGSMRFQERLTREGGEVGGRGCESEVERVRETEEGESEEAGLCGKDGEGRGRGKKKGGVMKENDQCAAVEKGRVGKGRKGEAADGNQQGAEGRWKGGSETESAAREGRGKGYRGVVQGDEGQGKGVRRSMGEDLPPRRATRQSARVKR